MAAPRAYYRWVQPYAVFCSPAEQKDPSVKPARSPSFPELTRSIAMIAGEHSTQLRQTAGRRLVQNAEERVAFGREGDAEYRHVLPGCLLDPFCELEVLDTPDAFEQVYDLRQIGLRDLNAHQAHHSSVLRSQTVGALPMDETLRRPHEDGTLRPQVRHGSRLRRVVCLGHPPLRGKRRQLRERTLA